MRHVMAQKSDEVRTGAIFQCDSSFELLWRDFIYLY